MGIIPLSNFGNPPNIKEIPQSLSLILPVYNEKNLLVDAVIRCLNALSKDFEDFEIIIVDDGSNDGTGEIIDELGEKNRHLKVLHNNINLNLGISIQRGFAIANKNYVLFDSIDLPLAPEDIAGLINIMNDNNFDVLVLERRSYRGASIWRKITSKINRVILHLLFPVASAGLQDMNYTLIFKRKIRSKIMPLAKSPAFTQPEMILRARYQRLCVGSVLVDYHPRPMGKSALGKPHDIIWSLYDMLRFRIKCFFQ